MRDITYNNIYLLRKCALFSQFSPIFMQYCLVFVLFIRSSVIIWQRISNSFDLSGRVADVAILEVLRCFFTLVFDLPVGALPEINKCVRKLFVVNKYIEQTSLVYNTTIRVERYCGARKQTYFVLRSRQFILLPSNRFRDVSMMLFCQNSVGYLPLFHVKHRDCIEITFVAKIFRLFCAKRIIAC